MNGTDSSKTQIIIMIVSAAIVLMAFSYKFGELINKQEYINQGAAQHWKGDIECSRVGNTVYCAKTGDVR